MKKAAKQVGKVATTVGKGAVVGSLVGGPIGLVAGGVTARGLGAVVGAALGSPAGREWGAILGAMKGIKKEL